MPAPWPRPVGWEPTAPRTDSPMPYAMSEPASPSGMRWYGLGRATSRSSAHCCASTAGGCLRAARRGFRGGCSLSLPGRLRSEVTPLLAVMRHLQPPLAYSDERIAAFTATDERVRRLQSVPNIGPVTAAAFVAAIDEASRFTDWQALLSQSPGSGPSASCSRPPSSAFRTGWDKALGLQCDRHVRP